MANRECPLCGGNDKHQIDTLKMILPKEYSLPSSYDIVACVRCGFCFADTSATLEDYNTYYSNCNTYSGTPVGESAWDKLHDTAKCLLAEKLSKDAQLLDMGFGQGNFLRYLKGNGYINVLGIDPSENSVKNVCKDGIKAVVGSVFEQPKGEYYRKFDCVFLFDVLEHLLFPRQAIANMSMYLRKGGYLLISVPNYNCLKKNNHPITNMFNQEHINYFSEKTLDYVMAEEGFIRMATNAEKVGEEEELIAMYRMTEEKTFSFQRDESCEAEIREYLQKFTARKSEIEKKLSELVRRGQKELYVWGTGAFTMWLLANTMLPQFHITFIDNNKVKVGQSFWKGVIEAPEDIVDSQMPILICSMLYAEQIRQQIHNMGIDNDILVV